MMNESYSAVYRDHHGKETTTIYNDGKQLTITVRDVTFTGNTWDDFSLQGMESDALALASFVTNRVSVLPPESGRFVLELCDYVLDWEMPIRVVASSRDEVATLRCHLELGRPFERGMLERKYLRLILLWNNKEWPGEGGDNRFEEELLTIGTALPDGVYLKNCFTCALSDYSVYGNGLFHGLLCFRDCKAQYKAVSHTPHERRKSDYMTVMDRYTEQVQETYLCPEWERRAPDTGYRG